MALVSLVSLAACSGDPLTSAPGANAAPRLPGGTSGAGQAAGGASHPPVTTPDGGAAGGASAGAGGANDGGQGDGPSGGGGLGGASGASSAALGATVIDGGVVFRVWAPHATSARVTGDFPAHTAAMSDVGGGVFSATVADAHANTIYAYAFDTPAGAITRLDPYCREVLPDASACTVVDPAAYAWKSGAFSRPARNASVVYELHVGSFAVAAGETAGTLASAQNKLVELAELGVSVVELMPVQDFGGKPGGWGYNPHLYLAPKPAYGSADELRAFVDAAHEHGIAVWLDTVVNHYDGWSKAPLACYDGDCAGSHGVYFFPPGPYEATPWGPRPDYTSPEVSAMLRASVSWWLDENHGDGFRWDSVSNVRALDGKGTIPGGRELLVAANELVHAAGGTSVAEDLKGWDGITKLASAGGFGFDAQWDGFGYTLANVLVPASDDGRDLGALQSALQGGYAGDPFARVLFTETHDTVGNGGARLPSRIDAANPTGLVARRRAMLGAAILLTTPGVPMLFMGQESLATGSFQNPPAPLDAAIPAAGAEVRAFYKDMIALRRNLGGLAGGLLDPGVEILHRNDAAKVLAYRRHGPSGEDVLVVVNLRNKAYSTYDVGVPGGGEWKIRLDSDWHAYGADFGGGQSGTIATTPTTKDGKPFTLPVKLGAYGAVVLSR